MLHTSGHFPLASYRRLIVPATVRRREMGGPGGRFYSLYSEACPTAAGFVLSHPRGCVMRLWGSE
jgi:hypothetical protein